MNYEYIKGIQKESQKNVKNMQIIRDRMERTFLYRQNEAQEGRLGVDAITAKYPASQFTVVVSTKRADSVFFTFISFCLVKILVFRCLMKQKEYLNWIWEDQLKNISPDVLSKIKKLLASQLKLVSEPLMQHLKDEVYEI